jgi:4-carboxymuconolactone decarboxylase
MPRTPEFDIEKFSPEQKRVHDAILSGPRGVVQGPLKVWLQSADLADKAQALGAFCRYGTSLPPRLSELAIIVTGAHWKAGFEWYAHAPLAAKGGIDPVAIEAIRKGQTPAFQKADEQVVYDFSTELIRNHVVSDATYKRAIGELGTKATVELVGILGYYGLISMTIKAFEVPVPDGETEPFADVK